MNSDQIKKIEKLLNEHGDFLKKYNIDNFDELSDFLKGLQTLLPDSGDDLSGSSVSNSKKIMCPHCNNYITVTLSK